MVLPFPPIPGLQDNQTQDPGMAFGMEDLLPPGSGFDEYQDPQMNVPQQREPEPYFPKPKPDEALKRIDSIKQFWRLRDERMDEDQRFYERKIGEENLEGNLVIRNIPYTMVEKAARVVGTQDPIYNIRPPKNVLKDEAQKVEDFIRHMWDVWNKKWRLSGQGTIYHDMAHYLSLRGWMAARITYDPDVDVEEIPVRMRLIDPRTVYPFWTEEGVLYIGHVYESTVGSMREKFPKARGEWTERDDDEVIQCKAYYDDWWYAYFVEDELVIPVQGHEYGFLPWVIMIAGGSPIRNTEFNLMDWTIEVGPSVFHGIKDAYIMLNRLLSQMADEVERQSNPPLLYFFDPTSRKKPEPIKFQPGSTNYLFFDRERVEPLTLEPSQTSIQPMISMLMEDVERGGLPSIMWGAAEESSGFQATLSQSAARDSLFPIVRTMEDAQEQIIFYSLQLIRDWHDEEVGFFVRDGEGDWVSGETINFTNIMQVGRHCDVKYKDLSPQDKMARANIAMALVEKNLISLHTARADYLELDNPDRENDRVISDLVYMDEELMKEVIIEKTLERTDPDLYQSWMEYKHSPERQQKEQQEEQMQQMPGGPGGGPGMPGGGVPGGEQLPPNAAPGAEQGTSAATLPGNMQGIDLLLQSLASSLGGGGAQRQQGVPGAGAMPLPMPMT